MMIDAIRHDDGRPRALWQRREGRRGRQAGGGRRDSSPQSLSTAIGIYIYIERVKRESGGGT
jgi:hypothetical protein